MANYLAFKRTIIAVNSIKNHCICFIKARWYTYRPLNMNMTNYSDHNTEGPSRALDRGPQHRRPQ